MFTIEFTLKGILGLEMAARMRAAISEDGVGYDPVNGDRARLEEDAQGILLWTLPMGAHYGLLNPDSGDPAVLEYRGDPALFGVPIVCPEFFGETINAVVSEGEDDILARHGFTGRELLAHEDVHSLVHVYRLLREAEPRAGGGTVAAAFAAVKAAAELDSLGEQFPKDRAGMPMVRAEARPGSTYAGSARRAGDPSVFISVLLAGQWVEVEFHLRTHWTPEESGAEVVVEATTWLNRLRSVIGV